LAACRTAPRQAPSASAPPVPTAEANAAGVAKARADSARYPYTAADVAFMTHMIEHHAQAITMSRLAPTNGASASIRTLADRIINAQQDEIALMQQWLRDRGQPTPDPAAMASHGDHAGHEAMTMMMPGMLSPAQMQQLQAARGPEFDRLFLTGMIQHHRGAIAMVNDLIATPGAAQDQFVFKLASDVNVDQTTEVERMTGMLAKMLFEPPPT
jgi:uncharacterized protein (DUF305 family)